MNGNREPLTNKRLTMGLQALLESIDMHYLGIDGFRAQDLLRPINDAIREAQRLVDIEREKASLAEQERRLEGMKGAIAERKQVIAALEKGSA